MSSTPYSRPWELAHTIERVFCLERGAGMNDPTFVQMLIAVLYFILLVAAFFLLSMTIAVWVEVVINWAGLKGD